MNIKQAAKRAGLTEGLLILWVSTGKFKPSVELSAKSSALPVGSIERRALQAYAGPDEEAFGWARYEFTDKDVQRLALLVEGAAPTREQALEKHQKGTAYTVAEIAALWSLSVDKVRDLFKNEPGVIKIAKAAKKGKRAYVNLRIPEAVAARVERRLA
jgi:hypothetical protein